MLACDVIEYYFEYEERTPMTTKHPVGKHYEEFVKGLVDSGRFATEGDVVREGHRLLEEREERRKAKLDALRADIQEGIDSGPSEAWDVEEILAEAKRRKAAASHGG
jgi:antitoxin ParD1/3/4